MVFTPATEVRRFWRPRWGPRPRQPRKSAVLISISEVSVRWTGHLSAIHEPCALAVVEDGRERDRPIDPIEHPLLRFAVCAVLGVDPIFEWQPWARRSWFAYVA